MMTRSHAEKARSFMKKTKDFSSVALRGSFVALRDTVWRV